MSRNKKGASLVAAGDTPHTELEGVGDPRKVHDNSAEAQRQRVLNYLRGHGSLTTIEARRFLDIMHPAARVMELKRQGHRIETHWINDVTEAGKPHRVARYLLAPRL